MARTVLSVPFHQKDEASRLGAKWDAVAKVWYVRDGYNPLPFAKWLAPEPIVNVRATEFIVVEVKAICWKCLEMTKVFSVMVGPGYQFFENNQWSIRQQPALLHGLSGLSLGIQSKMSNLSNNKYRPGVLKTGETHWLNRCSSCDIVQGDASMYFHVGGAFCGKAFQDYSAAKLHRVSLPLAVSAVIELESGFWDYGYRVEDGPWDGEFVFDMSPTVIKGMYDALDDLYMANKEPTEVMARVLFEFFNPRVLSLDVSRVYLNREKTTILLDFLKPSMVVDETAFYIGYLLEALFLRMYD